VTMRGRCFCTGACRYPPYRCPNQFPTGVHHYPYTNIPVWEPPVKREEFILNEIEIRRLRKKIARLRKTIAQLKKIRDRMKEKESE
jgi:hypothetical protein